MIDQATVQKIKDTADIVDVVSDYVHLVRRGGNYMGLCPFHNERTPSFSVNRHKNFCYCFSCKKGGSPVNFIMEKEGLSYHEALLHLARKYGIDVVEKELTDEERKAQSEREAMLVANEWALQRMHDNLLNTPDGRNIGLSYLFGRGVTEEAIRKFKLGYAIDKGYDLVDAAKRSGFDLEVLKKLGLIGTSQDGRNYDRFRGRVIFPILNSAGKVIAFGGRDLKGGLAKYINSPESQLYKKSNELYGIYQARSEMVKQDKCFLVEGYLDVIGMWQSGFQNTVASSGTALTDGQIALIHRFTENITLIYDGDAAGVKASLRGIDMLLNHGMKVKVLLLPDGHDPDSFAKGRSSEEVRKYIDEHETDILQFKAKVLLNDIKDPIKRIDAINSMVESLAHIADPVARDVYIQECSAIMSIPETTIAKSVSSKRSVLIEKWKKEKSLRSGQHPSGAQSPIPPQPVNAQNSQNTVNSAVAASGAGAANSSASQSALIDSEAAEREQMEAAFMHSMAGVDDARVEGSNFRQSPISGSLSQSSRNDSLLPLELNVIKYCVRYGYMNMCTVINDAGESHALSVIDYIKEELEADNLQFRIPVYNQIFKIIVGLKSQFLKDLAAYEILTDKNMTQRKTDGITEIASMDLSVLEIKKAEKKLVAEIEAARETEIRDFSRDYAGKQLASHEITEVRNTAIELLQERHHLSNIYLKDPTNERIEDKLESLVPRALTEWRSELLNNRLKEVMTELKEISGKGDAEAESRIQQELNSIMTVRSRVAKAIGDRILQPNR